MKQVNYRILAMLFALTIIYAVQDTPVLAGDKGNQEIYGQITDLFGNPIQGATIELVGDERQIATADQEGNYRLINIQTGEKNIVVKFRGFVQEKILAFVKEGEKRLLNVGLRVGNLSSTPSLKITGTVVSANGLPLAYTRITLINAFNHQVSFQSFTNHRGKYNLSVNHPGQYILYAYRYGYLLKSTIVSLRFGPQKVSFALLSVRKQG